MNDLDAGFSLRHLFTSFDGAVSPYNILACSEYDLCYLGDVPNQYLVINGQDVLGMRFDDIRKYYPNDYIMNLISIEKGFSNSDEYFKLVNLAMNKPEVWAFTFEKVLLDRINRSGVTDLSQQAELLIERVFDFIWRDIPVEYEMPLIFSYYSRLTNDISSDGLSSNIMLTANLLDTEGGHNIVDLVTSTKRNQGYVFTDKNSLSSLIKTMISTIDEKDSNKMIPIGMEITGDLDSNSLKNSNLNIRNNHHKANR